jgi:hypothetical protein
VASSLINCAGMGQDEDTQAGVLLLTAWNDPEEFRGLKLGQSLKGQIQKCPPNFRESKKRCWAQVGQPNAYGEVLYQLHNFGPIGNLPQGSMIAIEVHNRLHSISITMSHDLYSQLRDTVLQRYGTPTSEHTEEVVTKAGVKWPTKTIIWHGSYIIIELFERVVHADKTTLHAHTLEFVDHLRRKDSQQQKKGASDL